MKPLFFTSLAFLVAMAFLTCASRTKIFPAVDLSTNTSRIVLPNPIAIVADTTNSQIVVSNSNVDIFYNQGSLAVIDVDATTPTAPVLTVRQSSGLIAAPNYSGQMAFDSVNSFLYIPFRESAAGSSADQIVKYSLGADSISAVTFGTVSQDPFGIALSGTSVLVVSDNKLDLLDTNLTSQRTFDLTQAGSAGIAFANSGFVEGIAVDAATNRAFVTNRFGKIFVVDLNTNTFSHVIDGPTNTRAIGTDGTYVYAVDGNPPALWVLDPARLSAPASAPAEVDDSTLLVKVIDLGEDPNGLAIDAISRRAYVANSFERSISVIDLNLLEPVARVSLKNQDTGLKEAVDPFGLAVGTFNGVPFIFVANAGSNTISVINGVTLTVVASFPN